MGAALDFWFEFASTYSYPAAMRIEERAAKRHVTVNWRPFLLGPIFQAQGWDTSPFNIYEAKGRYMWRDLERICLDLGLPFQRPDVFPQNGLTGARVALSLEGRERMRFSRALYTAQFAFGRNIGEESTIADALSAAGIMPEPALLEAKTNPVKNSLRLQTTEAAQRGIFGAPSFITSDGELFWGNDRLEDALIWAANLGGET